MKLSTVAKSFKAGCDFEVDSLLIISNYLEIINYDVHIY